MSKLRNLPASLKVFLKGCLTFITVAAVFVVTMAFAHGADNQQQKMNEQGGQAVVSKQDDASASELYAVVKKPTTPMELLKNIKFALDHELLLRDDFYTDENLMRFLGGSRVEWVDNRPGLRRVEVRNLGNLFEMSSSWPGMGISAVLLTTDEKNRGYVEGGSRLKGRIGIYPLGDSRMTIEAVESVFGKPTEVYNPYAGEKPPYGTKLGPKTHPLGHMAFKYRFDHPTSKVIVGFDSGGSGKVTVFNASLTEVK
jgi:hypothetical protein